MAPARRTAGLALPSVVPVSARNASSLVSGLHQLADHIERNRDVPLVDIAYSYQVGKVAFPFRAAAVARTHEEMIVHCRTLAGRLERSAPAGVSAVAEPRVAFLFSGQGSQYPGMGKELFDTSEIFRDAILRCAAVLDRKLPVPLRDLLFEAEFAAMLGRTEFTQPALFAYQYALAQLWISIGFVPCVVLGHSLGEWTAACIAGAYTLEEACTLVAARGALMVGRCEPGAMIAVGTNAAAVHDLLGSGYDLEVAAINGEDQTVVAGTGTVIEAFAHELARLDLPHRRLDVSHAFHSRAMVPMLEPLAGVVSPIPVRALDITLIGNSDGATVAAPLTAEHWLRQTREPVQFTRCLETLNSHDCDVVIEIGPKAALAHLARAVLNSDTLVVSARAGQTGEPHAIADALAECWVAGVQIPWDSIGGPDRRRVRVPTYPFDRTESMGATADPGRSGNAAPAEQAPMSERRSTPQARRPSLAVLLEIWCDTLGKTDVDADTEFGKLGGDSLDAIKLLNHIRKATGVTISMAELYRLGTLRAVAELHEGRAVDSPPETGARASSAGRQNDGGQAPQARRQMVGETEIRPGTGPAQAQGSAPQTNPMGSRMIGAKATRPSPWSPRRVLVAGGRPAIRFHLVRELLSSSGADIYTSPYSRDMVSRLPIEDADRVRGVNLAGAEDGDFDQVFVLDAPHLVALDTANWLSVDGAALIALPVTATRDLRQAAEDATRRDPRVRTCVIGQLAAIGQTELDKDFSAGAARLAEIAVNAVGSGVLPDIALDVIRPVDAATALFTLAQIRDRPERLFAVHADKGMEMGSLADALRSFGYGVAVVPWHAYAAVLAANVPDCAGFLADLSVLAAPVPSEVKRLDLSETGVSLSPPDQLSLKAVLLDAIQSGTVPQPRNWNELHHEFARHRA
ncbi:acyltransferase domain-containing protein [Nitrospirillum iridis]|uniref:acyltransferase domain-containing protein n=1 Tax=Nitrospirillum iridis TaxID=765888 RepID=UPI0031B564AC